MVENSSAVLKKQRIHVLLDVGSSGYDRMMTETFHVFDATDLTLINHRGVFIQKI